MRTDVVRAASPSWNMVLRRTEEQQFYMELTPLLFYFGAMVLRQAKCNSVCSSETVHSVQEFLNKLSKMQNCSKSTMTCFEKEMTVLVHETEQNSNLPTRLKKLTRYLSDKTHPCPQCEVYKEEKAEIFLNTLLHILQIMCSINNTVTKSESK
ncbi:interleukin 15, like isoform X3 [Neoarius graeffei]|uniref:interleukin 15, like isoform X3 n=1 Tax=Neoarius graeffei TaxID=443677 RepID=UPI00298BD2E9|nr:interleukin 15, like isoform X3 [Neoarius graeffei]